MNGWEILDFENGEYEIKSISKNGSGKLLRLTYRKTPIVKKSNEAWVVRHIVDYLFTSDSKYTKENIEAHFECYLKGLNYDFKPFSEIIINDEVAKLRPFVIIGNTNSELSILAMVIQNRVFNIQKLISYSNDIKLCRLATVDDLED